MKQQNDIINTLKKLEKLGADATPNAALGRAPMAAQKVSSTPTPKASSVYMRQRPRAGGWEKKCKKLNTPGQKKLNRW